MSSRRRTLIAATAISLTVLTACGASAPPGKELADELIDTLAVDDSVKACMHTAVADFELTPEQATGFSDFDDVAQKASEGNELAKSIMNDFEAALAACN